MGTCLSKKKGSSTTSPLAGRTKSATTAHAVSELKNSSRNGETEPEVELKKENKKVLEKHESAQEGGKGHVKRQIFIIKHRKSHDDRERNDEQNAPQSAANTEAIKGLVVGVRTSSCTKEEVDAILIQCGRLSRNSSGKAASSSPAAGRRYRSGSKRSFDFDHCHNDKVNASDDLCEDDAEKRHRQSPRPLSQDSSSSRRRRRTPSREREQQQQRSSSRERRVSRSPGRRSSETTTSSNTNASSSRPGKMVSVPATVSSLAVVDKTESAAAAAGSIKRITVRRNVGAASPRSQSPARANGNASNANKALSENQQQQPSLSRNPSRKAEQSPYRRNPLSQVDPNSLAFPHSATNDNSSRVVQNRPKKEFETEANNQKPNASRIALDKGVGVDCNCKTKVQQEGDVKVQSSVTDDDVVVKTVVPPGVDNLLFPQTLLIRSRSSRRSRDLDLNPEALLIPPQSYTSLLLEDIQNFHQKNTPPVPLPACVTKAYSILEAVADLNSNTTSNFCGEEGRRNRNEYNVPLGTTNNHGKRVPDTKDPVVESEVVVNDDVLEPSLHKYVTVNSSRGGVEMEEQESSGSNSFTISSGKQHRGISSSSSSWEPSSADSKDYWTSGLNNCREEGQKSPLGLEGRVSSEAGCDVDGAKKKLSSKRRECDHQHVSGIGRGRLGANNVLHKKPVVTAAAST